MNVASSQISLDRSTEIERKVDPQVLFCDLAGGYLVLLGAMNLLVEEQLSRQPRLSRKWRMGSHVAAGTALVCFGHLRMQRHSDVVVALVFVAMGLLQVWTDRRGPRTQAGPVDPI